MPAFSRSIRFLVGTALLTAGLIWATAFLQPFFNSRFFNPQLQAQAQRIRTESIWQEIYQQMPDLPLENQYVNKETGEVSSDNTLLNRLIRYHIYVKGRPTAYRLDWKLTLADYLGINERIEPKTYPSADTLRTDPLPGDRAAVQSLTRAQRDALVDALVRLFNPNASTEPAASPAPSPSPTASPMPAPSRFPSQPQPGDAQLLQPQ